MSRDLVKRVQCSVPHKNWPTWWRIKDGNSCNFKRSRRTFHSERENGFFCSSIMYVHIGEKYRDRQHVSTNMIVRDILITVKLFAKLIIMCFPSNDSRMKKPGEKTKCLGKCCIWYIIMFKFIIIFQFQPTWRLLGTSWANLS